MSDNFPGMAGVQLLETTDAPRSLLGAIRRLLDEAFDGDFSEEDWDHALGGWHAIVRAQESIVAHAAVVERRIFVGSRAYRTGYVEAVAVSPAHRRRGLGTAVMTAATALVRAKFDLGALSTGESGFYARLGWERWAGPSYVRDADGRLHRSADEDAGIMVLRCGASQAIDCGDRIACEARTGDSW